MAVNNSKGLVRFEAFELDLRAGELRKEKVKISSGSSCILFADFLAEW
jgi:hypothetical protein